MNSCLFSLFLPGCKCWLKAAADHREAPDEPLYIHCPQPPASSSIHPEIQLSNIMKTQTSDWEWKNIFYFMCIQIQPHLWPCTKHALCWTNLMLQQNPVDEQCSNVLLFPMELQEGRGHCLNLPTSCSLILTTISSLVRFPSSPCFPLTSWQEWSFSSVSQTPSCECLGKTWGHWWSVVRQTGKRRHETLAGLLQDWIMTFHTWVKFSKEMKRAGHLNYDEKWLCVILRVLQDVIWIGWSGY